MDERRRRIGLVMLAAAVLLTAGSIAFNAVADAAWYSWLLNGVAVGAIIATIAFRIYASRTRRRADELHRRRVDALRGQG